jgi:hypothetical protein
MNAVRNFTERARRRNAMEGRTTKNIERVTAAIPSSTWLVLAGGTIAGALTLKLLGRDQTANFVGEWVPTILMLGMYNKVVKLMGSDRREAMGSW